MSIEALILDFGEVLVRPQSATSIERMAQLARLDIDEFRQRYWRHRHDYDAGLLSDADYWRRVIDGAAVPDADVAVTLEALMTADFLSWNDAREEMWELAAAFKARGGRTAMLSNGVPAVIARLRAARPLAGYFDAVVVSCEVGCAKPDPRIYEICLATLGIRAAAALFVDDRLENVEAAERQGLHTLHFAGDESVARLRQLIGAAGPGQPR